MKVTVLLPVYNGSKYINGILDSMSKQTYKNIEFIVMDHGSTDNSWDIISNSNVPTKKIKYERIPEDYKYNASRILSDAIYNHSNGELIAFLSHDDLLSENYILNNVIEYINNKDMKIWNSAIWWFDSNKGISVREKEPKLYYYEGMKDLKTKMVERSVINCPSVFFTRELLNKVGMSQAKYMNAGDYEHFLRIIDCGYYIYPIRKFLGYFYGVNELQCTTQIHTKQDGYDIRLLQNKYRERWAK